ncbi:SAV_6107 family HEPN domain-containing protein [Streptomyces sp. NBC_01233]|uniref:SAV_6107 family HEPN domain-containing protein n=1 Tax=Streptomyces sp. NBC_01233 TaxID=2903787 RepID=UPI002E0E5C21|nr:SAV_6107 family HEPN domain-containing protein [Streptomyces sp. NBC_01233]
MLAKAREGLEVAGDLDDPLEQYAVLHLSALRAAAAVLAAMGRPERIPGRRPRIRSAWEMLPELAPELAEFAEYFAAAAPKRARAEAGIAEAVNAHDVADLRRVTTLFLRQVATLEAVKESLATRDTSSGNGTASMPRSS